MPGIALIALEHLTNSSTVPKNCDALSKARMFDQISQQKKLIFFFTLENVAPRGISLYCWLLCDF